MMSKAVVASIVTIADLVVSPGHAACVTPPESSDTIVRGRFVRCEDARFHLEASGAYAIHERDLERALAQVSPEDQERLLERLEDGVLTRNLEARVVVVALDWHVPIVSWVRETSESVEFDQPRESREIVRYWWSGPIETCDGMTAGSLVDLWAYSPCCDALEFASPECIVAMRYAEPIPDAIGDAFSSLIGER